mgnify:CR=1 FL=1
MVMLGLSQYVYNVVELVDGLRKLQPSFLTACAAGQQCLSAILQLTLSSMQYISSERETVLAQAGKEEWTERWLAVALGTASSTASAADRIVKLFNSEQQASGSTAAGATSGNTSSSSSSSRSSTSSGASSRAGSRDTASGLGVLQAEQLLQWYCLRPIVWMLAQHMQEATATGSSQQHGQLGENRIATASSSVSEQQWLPVALAPTMPAAYSMMLEQQGVSREVGLWLATLTWNKDGSRVQLELRGSPALETTAWLDTSVGVWLSAYDRLMSALSGNNINHTQLAVLHLSMAASIMQWLSSMQPARLFGLQGGCSQWCRLAAQAFTHGHSMVAKHSLQQLEQLAEQATGVKALVVPSSANSLVAQLSVVMLEKLLSESRSVLHTGESSSSGHTGTAGGGSSSSGSSSMLLQSSQHVVGVLTAAAVVCKSS